MDKGFAFASKQTENIAAFHSRKMTNKKAVLDVNLSYFVSLGKRWSIMSWQTCYYGEINKDHLKRNTNGPWKLLTPAVGEWWITLIWVGTDWLWLFCEITAAVIFRGIIMREKTCFRQNSILLLCRRSHSELAHRNKHITHISVASIALALRHWFLNCYAHRHTNTHRKR